MSNDWARDGFVRRVLDAFRRPFNEEVGERLMFAMGQALSRPQLESPLEAAFLACWELYRLMPYGNGVSGGDFSLVQQVEVSGYRLDFQVTLAGDHWRGVAERYPKICIELDGHEFHERTKEQVTHRNRRDRALSLAGWRVVRFSGSEVYRNPLQCVKEAWRQADWALADAKAAQWQADNPGAEVE